MNILFQKQNLSDIDLNLFQEVLTECLSQGHSGFAPLGASGDDFILYTQYNPSEKPSRVTRDRQLSIRLHNSTPEMLITDRDGRFIFYGKFHKTLGVEFISNEFFRLFKELKGFLAPDSI